MEDIGFFLDEPEENLANCCAPLLEYIEDAAETSTFAKQLTEAETGSAFSVELDVSNANNTQASTFNHGAENAVYEGEF